MTALGCASGLLNAGFFMLWLAFGELQAKSVRDKLFGGILEKDMEWFDMRKDGVEALIQRVQTQIRELQLATSQPVGFAIQYSVTALAALGLAAFYAWDLTLITLATVPFSGFVLAWISARMQPSIDAQSKELTKCSKYANNAIQAIDTVKCFSGQDFELWQYSKAVKRAAKYYLLQARANAFQIGFVRFITLAMFVQGFWYGSHLVQTGKKNAGEVLTAFWACLMATQAFEQILPQMIVLEKGRAAGATLKAILFQMESKRRVIMQGHLTPSFCEGDIEVRNVSFSYPSRPDHLALSNASFFFPARETTFIIGRSGSGKSTVGNLLMRFYALSSGDIFLDGHPIQTLDINWLRNNITLVQQQSVLFNDTVFKNIAFGRKDWARVRREDVSCAIETAFLQHTLADFPHGLETLVGAGGNAMSGGQKQRVAIARARLRDTPILILDEATSALDYISRGLVMEAIREWREGKTTIIITHDPSQIAENEYAYILDKGVTVQEGYRGTLEKEPLGPLAINRRSFLNEDPLSSLPDPQTQLSNVPAITASRPSYISGRSDDSLNIRYRFRQTFAQSMFSASPDNQEDVEEAASSQHLIPLISPAIFSMRRVSGVPRMSPAPSWSRTKPIQALDSTLASQTQEQEMRDVNLINEWHEASEIEAGNHPRRTARTLEAHSKAIPLDTRGPLKGKLPRRHRKPTKAEKDRRAAPVKKILLTVWPALSWRQRMMLILGFTCATVHATATPVFSYVFAKLLSTFSIKAHRSEMALKWSFSVLAVATCDAVASFVMHYLLEKCGQIWVDTLRVEAMKRMLDQPRAWFDRDKNKRSKLTDSLDQNAEEMRNLLGRFAAFIFIAVLMTTISIVWSLILSWKLTLVALAAAPILYLLTRSFETVSGKWESKSNDVGLSCASIFTETFSNIRTIRALTLEGYFHKKYLKSTNRAFKTGLQRSLCSGLFFGLSDSAIIFVTALIFYFGAILISSKASDVELILTVFAMLLFSIANVNAIVGLIPQISTSRVTATRLLRLSSLPYQASHEHTGHIRLSEPGEIVFRGLNFNFPSQPAATPILQNLDLILPARTTTVLVGASGSGKSTLTSLILGLYATQPGQLSFSGYPIESLHLPTLRSLISIVPQTPHLLPATISENIAYGLPEQSSHASASSVRRAAKLAGIGSFIRSLPLGYSTLIGEGGTGLSGGQAQRIAIARAVVRKPKLLILDEATSALDEESAAGVRKLVKRLAEQGVGVLIVSHERGMMEGREDVVVLAKGEVVERGRFGELMGRRRGELRRLLGEGMD
ncbi:MAG: hypothetical protein Q9167_003882 [Letrouitia subvulpina]